MIKHCLKIIWNRKRFNILLIVEFFLTFMIIFAVTLVVYNYFISKKSGFRGFEYDNVMFVSIPVKADSKQGIDVKKDLLFQQISALPGVEVVSLNGIYPFQDRSYIVTVGRNDRRIESQEWVTDEHFNNVMGIRLLSGRWFRDNENQDGIFSTVIINSYLKDELFADENPIGKKITINNEEKLVIGVVGDYHPSAKSSVFPGYFAYRDKYPVDNFYSFVKFRQSVNYKSYQQIIEVLEKNLGSVEKGVIKSAKELKKVEDNNGVSVIVVMSAICIFLTLNALIGMFGVLWQNINKRRSEIALRKAVGATQSAIYIQIILEVVILVSFALIPAALVISQFAYLGLFKLTPFIYLNSYLLSSILVYLLVIACALYPGIMAARIEPALALHEE